MTSPSPMKSPDRDAADELARKYDELSALMKAGRYAFNDLNAHGKTILDFMNVWLDQAQDQARKDASELATLRRRVAEDQRVRALLQEAIDSMRLVAESQRRLNASKVSTLHSKTITGRVGLAWFDEALAAISPLIRKE